MTSTDAMETRLSPGSGKFTNIVKHTDLWLEDGDIVLIAGGVGFRVHVGVLGRHSMVFGDMFTLGQPDSTDDTYDGCPVLSLSDPASGVAAFLRAIYHGWNLHLDSNSDYVLICDVLELSNKYDVRGIHAKAVSELSTIFPSTLEDWDFNIHALRDDLTHPMHVSNISSKDILEMLSRVDRCNTPMFLPSAFLYICRLYWKHMPHNPHHPDLTIFLHDSHTQFARFVVCKDTLQSWVFNFLRNFGKLVGPISKNCKSVQCSPYFADMERDLTRRIVHMHEDWLAEPLTITMSISENANHRHSRLCNHCASTFTRNVAQERQKLWDSLPALLGLPSWEKMAEGGFETQL